MPETTLYKVNPSQWLNLWHFLGAGLLAITAIAMASASDQILWIGLALAIFWAGWRWLSVHCEHYELTTQRIRVTTGVLNQKIDEIELYRVKDLTMTRAFWMRIVGLSSIHLKTSDRTLPTLTIPAISNGEELREQLREQVEKIRDKKRVREMDFADTGDGGEFDGDMDLQL